MTLNRYGNLVFADCEAAGTSPVSGVLTEFGAVHYATREIFHGRLWIAHPDPVTPAIPVPVEKIATEDEIAHDLTAWLTRLALDGKLAGRPVLVSDNPAYDFMWIAGLFDTAGMPNPFGHSGRRISDFWAGIQGNWKRQVDMAWRCSCGDGHFLSVMYWKNDPRMGLDVEGYLSLEGNFRSTVRRRVKHIWQLLTSRGHIGTWVGVCLDAKDAREIAGVLLDYAGEWDAYMAGLEKK